MAIIQGNIVVIHDLSGRSPLVGMSKSIAGCRTPTGHHPSPENIFLSVLERQAEFPNHIEELRDLVRVGFPVSRLQAQRALHLRVRVDIMAAADPAWPEAETFDEPREFGKADVAQIALGEAVPCPLRGRLMGVRRPAWQRGALQSSRSLQIPP
jgi:hypothetical protein